MTKFTSWLFGTRCEFCDAVISEQKVYTARSEMVAGVVSAISATEPELYDCVDCPKCGRQHIIGRRLRNE